STTGSFHGSNEPSSRTESMSFCALTRVVTSTVHIAVVVVALLVSLVQPLPHGVVVLTERGRRTMHGRVGIGRGIVEPQRRAGQLEVTEAWMTDVDQQALGQRLLPGVDLVERANFAGRHTSVGQARQPVLRRLGGQDGVDVGDQLV